jgi:DNA topoisomerase-3
LPLGSLQCPRCREGHLITGGRGWGCDRWKQGCSFVVWFETAGKRLTVAQLRALVTKGKTAKAKFVDGSGKPIEARLVLDVSIAGGAHVMPIDGPSLRKSGSSQHPPRRRGARARSCR